MMCSAVCLFLIAWTLPFAALGKRLVVLSNFTDKGKSVEPMAHGKESIEPRKDDTDHVPPLRGSFHCQASTMSHAPPLPREFLGQRGHALHVLGDR